MENFEFFQNSKLSLNKKAPESVLLGDNRTRTDHLLIANQPLYQMSYIPRLGGVYYKALKICNRAGIS